MANIGGKEVGTNDLMVIAGGAVLLVISFFHWSGNKVCANGQCETIPGAGGISGWNSGFFGWGGLILTLAGVVLVALRIFTTVALPKLPVPESMAIVALTGLGTLLILLRLIFGYHFSEFGVSGHISRGFGLYIAVIAAIVVTAGAVQTFLSGGGKFSDFKDAASNRGGSPTPTV